MIRVTTIASSSALDRSFCDRTQLEDNPETDERLALVGGQGVAVGAPAGGRLVAPRPPPEDAILARRRPRRRLAGRTGVVIGAEPAGALLPHVAVHVEQSERVGLERTDARRA